MLWVLKKRLNEAVLLSTKTYFLINVYEIKHDFTVQTFAYLGLHVGTNTQAVNIIIVQWMHLGLGWVY